jgi:Trk K+ transport system NAD-binding subunit
LIIPNEGNAYVPTASTVLKADDQIIAITTLETDEALKSALRGM